MGSPLSRQLTHRFFRYLAITSQSDPGVFDTNDTAFALNNGPLTYYVNDNSTLDDVYCAAIGDPYNDG